MIFDLVKDTKINENYKLMAQIIIPRPIAWVVTQNNGVINIASFSYFIGLSSEPATVLISIEATPKDTLSNIRKNKKYVIHMVDEPNLQKMHFSSKSIDKDLSEAELFDIATKIIFDDFLPMIKDVPCAYFCILNQEINLNGKTIPLVLIQLLELEKVMQN